MEAKRGEGELCSGGGILVQVQGGSVLEGGRGEGKGLGRGARGGERPYARYIERCSP